MKNILFILILSCSLLFGQFKEEYNQPIDIRGGIVTGESSSLFSNFINPDNFNMTHSFSMSYSAMGNQSIALGIYTNSMSYKFNDQLDIEVDASLVNSPYSSFGDDFAEQINGIYLSRARINFRPSENLHMVLQYNSMPFGYDSRYGGYYNSSFNRYGYFPE